MATTNSNQWHANYWNEQKHGEAWNRAKEVFKRDWSQTKADFNVKSGQDLDQDVDDTVKQLVGRDVVPPPGKPNEPDYDKVEPALSYGLGAHEEYGQQYPDWNEKLESKLSAEWDDTKTGMKFKDVQPFVRRGWNYRA